ncbi:NAD(P)/FAD-dependent oxidoreductase [Ponticaulis sp.]|uniref:flavin-containing monooxygenase n=1 Tax=Ponticaulis sp. TaxID=2020902 RepID=UPI000B62E948|nr:NAD(P)/FAD-dependent oxidoreductase [Ponticaulis sp.]MAI92046.1 FAD-containing monooxygenase EthA [Ponticaulis sp.]OUX96225.1 MAG: FAD-containing monooxygenase EthA [Hyphomonadaceae bacterium TMED5]|tara:strand:+ start:12664 stop:14214 length:1551 start_codon:yes stop_codon:yes gene_type:complete
MSEKAEPEFFDVLIVGAGLSGIGAAYHLQQKCPDKSYVILEGRDAIGGTWDLFRYPGVRSDSDMHTLGYSFKPWRKAKAIADGPSIRSYVRDTADENGITQHIRFGQSVVSADWESETSSWRVRTNGSPAEFRCGFLMMCSGYYSYEKGYTPDFPRAESFSGTILHPQAWDENFDYSGQKVVIIGSGATAVTLVPEMAKHAEHVTMLQRSPTYMFSRPAEDKVANSLRKYLPEKLAYTMTRWKNVLMQMFFFNMAQKEPEKIKQRLIGAVKQQLGPDFDVEKHFTPSYNPWDQRLCLVPDNDLFDSIREGSASIVTDHIDHFDQAGIVLKSGERIDADLIVTATGLDLKFLGGVDFAVDGRAVVPNDLLNYKGLMFSGMPNMASVFGYTNASWTLKADISSEFVCRLLNHMDSKGLAAATPVNEDADIETENWLNFSSGYIQRSLSRFPQQAVVKPWKLNQNYAADLMTLRYSKLDDGVMQFSVQGETVPMSVPPKQHSAPIVDLKEEAAQEVAAE